MKYRFGHSFKEAARILYADGGYGRYYQGVGAALVQGIYIPTHNLKSLISNFLLIPSSGPVARFGDTAANAGILALLESNPTLSKLPTHIQTIFASLLAALFRMVLTPIDTVKTTLQAQGKPGWAILRQRIKIYGLTTLFYGAVATAAATFVGHYPWFSTVSLPPGLTSQKYSYRRLNNTILPLRKYSIISYRRTSPKHTGCFRLSFAKPLLAFVHP